MTETVILTRVEYDDLLDQIADLQATLALEHAVREDDGLRIPHEVVKREVLEGLHPVAAWRRFRGLTLRDLAAASGMSDAYISEIERRRKAGSVGAYRTLAKALGAPIEALIPDTE